MSVRSLVERQPNSTRHNVGSNPTGRATMGEKRGEQKAYSRGYYAAATHKWHPHKPPFPPQAEVARLMEAAQKLRDEVDSMCGQFGWDDEVSIKMDPLIQGVDDAMAAIGEWLKSKS